MYKFDSSHVLKTLAFAANLKKKLA